MCSLCNTQDLTHIQEITWETDQAMGKESHINSTGQARGMARSSISAAHRSKLTQSPGTSENLHYNQ